MDIPPTGSDTAALELLFLRAQEACDRGDKRAGATRIHQILSQDIHHPGAWRLLHSLLAPTQPFDEFQYSFAQKYYPAQAAQLAPPSPSIPIPPISREIPAAIPTPIHAGEMRFCQRCGQPRAAGAQFCARCGQPYDPAARPTPYPAQPAPQDSWDNPVPAPSASAVDSLFVSALTEDQPYPRAIPSNTIAFPSERERSGSTAYRLGELVSEQMPTILGAVALYVFAGFALTWILARLMERGGALNVWFSLRDLLPFPLLILALNRFRVNRHFFAAFLNPSLIVSFLRYFFIYLMMNNAWNSILANLVSLALIFSTGALWFLTAVIWDLPKLNLKRGFIWAGIAVICITALILVSSIFQLSGATYQVFSLAITILLATGLAVGYLLFPFAYQTRATAKTQTGG